MIYFILFILGIITGWVLWQIAFYLKMKRMLDSIANAPKPELKVVNITLVRMDHAVLAYDKATQMFLGQGATKDELIDILRKRFPSTNFMVNSKNLREIYNDTTE